MLLIAVIIQYVIHDKTFPSVPGLEQYLQFHCGFEVPLRQGVEYSPSTR